MLCTELSSAHHGCLDASYLLGAPCTKERNEEMRKISRTQCALLLCALHRTLYISDVPNKNNMFIVCDKTFIECLSLVINLLFFELSNEDFDLYRLDAFRYVCLNENHSVLIAINPNGKPENRSTKRIVELIIKFIIPWIILF